MPPLSQVQCGVYMTKYIFQIPQVNPYTGVVTVSGILDRETANIHALVLQAMEKGETNSATASVTIQVTDVNDNAPLCANTAFRLVIRLN